MSGGLWYCFRCSVRTRYLSESEWMFVWKSESECSGKLRRLSFVVSLGCVISFSA